MLHEVMAGHDPLDSTSIDAPVPPIVEAARRADVRGMRIGMVRELTGEGYQAGVQQRFDEAVQHLVDAGAEVVEVSCPSFTYALATYYLILPSEASSNLAKFDAMRYGLRVAPRGVDDPSAEQVMAATRDAGFGDEVKRRIILGTYALSSGYYDAYYGSGAEGSPTHRRRLRIRLRARRRAGLAHGADDRLPSGQPRSTTRWRCTSTTSRRSRRTWRAFPGCRCPAGSRTRTACPAGFQILAPAMADDRLYAVGAALEQRLHAVWGGPLLDRIPDLLASAPTTPMATPHADATTKGA
jgi:aspartyl-tRNA(Asn)/glutamyl-tRNA(Gln) amidotransferase subunit A